MGELCPLIFEKMEKEKKKSINLIEGNGVISVSVDDFINRYYADNISSKRKLEVKKYNV